MFGANLFASPEFGQSGTGFIATVHSITQSATGRIAKTYAQTIHAASRIALVMSKSQSATAFIKLNHFHSRPISLDQRSTDVVLDLSSSAAAISLETISETITL